MYKSEGISQINRGVLQINSAHKLLVRLVVSGNEETVEVWLGKHSTTTTNYFWSLASFPSSQVYLKHWCDGLLQTSQSHSQVPPYSAEEAANFTKETETEIFCSCEEAKTWKCIANLPLSSFKRIQFERHLFVKYLSVYIESFYQWLLSFRILAKKYVMCSPIVQSNTTFCVPVFVSGCRFSPDVGSLFWTICCPVTWPSTLESWAAQYQAWSAALCCCHETFFLKMTHECHFMHRKCGVKNFLV